MTRTMLTKNFTLEELCASDRAVRMGIDNTVPDELRGNIQRLADTLQEIRDKVLDGKPIHVNSGYRSPKLNALIGGSSKTSAHMQALAADFTCPEFGAPLEVCRAIAKSGIAFDQIIFEGTWCHISVDPKLRNMLLTATFGDGKPTYREGLLAG